MMINDYKFSRVCLALARDTASKEKALPMHLHPLYQVNDFDCHGHDNDGGTMIYYTRR